MVAIWRLATGDGRPWQRSPAEVDFPLAKRQTTLWPWRAIACAQKADQAAIDQFGHGSKVVGVGRFVDLALGPFGDGATERDLRLSDQTRVVLEVLVDEVAELFIGVTSGGLQISAPPIFEAVARILIAHAAAIDLVAKLGWLPKERLGRSDRGEALGPDLHEPLRGLVVQRLLFDREPAALMSDLCQEMAKPELGLQNPGLVQLRLAGTGQMREIVITPPWSKHR
jgi:hypothetical protein